jgi:hypothetical protein
MPLSLQNALVVIALVLTVFLESQPIFLRLVAVPLAGLVVLASLAARRDH